MTKTDLSQPKLFAARLPGDLDAYDLDRLKPLVSPSRRLRSEKFLFKQDKARCLIGELLLRYGLFSCGIKICEPLGFEQNRYGKPSLAGFGNIEFSISHSGDWVLVGISDSAIGVDVERVHEIGEGIANRFFSARECALLERCTDRAAFLDMFFRIWVLKEAYIKAIGMGLSCSLEAFSVDPDAEEPVWVQLHDEALPNMYQKKYLLEDGYKAAVCRGNELFPGQIIVEELPSVLSRLESESRNS